MPTAPPSARRAPRAAWLATPLLATPLLAMSLLAALTLGGCISVPPDLEADMRAPDGARPNNFGRMVDTPEGPVVRPDRPTLMESP